MIQNGVFAFESENAIEHLQSVNRKKMCATMTNVAFAVFIII